MTTNRRGAGPTAPAGTPAAGPRRMAALRFPADKDYLALARTTAMHIAALLELPLSRVTDLRLAVDEACAAFLTAGAQGTLELRYDLRPDGLCVSVRGSVPPSWPQVDQLGWTMLQALVGDVRAEVADGIGTLTLVERLPAPPAASKGAAAPDPG